jgi:hypothetical protein
MTRDRISKVLDLERSLEPTCSTKKNHTAQTQQLHPKTLPKISLAKNPPKGAIKLAKTAKTSACMWMGRHLASRVTLPARKRDGAAK